MENFRPFLFASLVLLTSYGSETCIKFPLRNVGGGEYWKTVGRTLDISQNVLFLHGHSPPLSLYWQPEAGVSVPEFSQLRA
jgi:hypothetical protein